jgi:hypothetical protein
MLIAKAFIFFLRLEKAVYKPLLQTLHQIILTNLLVSLSTKKKKYKNIIELLSDASTQSHLASII